MLTVAVTALLRTKAISSPPATSKMMRLVTSPTQFLGLKCMLGFSFNKLGQLYHGAGNEPWKLLAAALTFKLAFSILKKNKIEAHEEDQ
ncbi:hypothetical protein LSP04_02400 [Levilactobacillus spicheri]|uniref:Uncharacterized protein n=1 Tax=Levilactobacillus spicheri TaxID=216463 RepID=A0ABQ0WLD5_9LACO|nr:hypothetical protein LSP04_02400 [Levilactobacillus spicheri]